MAYLSSQDDRSTGVEIQVVLHPIQEMYWIIIRSTGVEIQVVLHHIDASRYMQFDLQE